MPRFGLLRGGRLTESFNRVAFVVAVGLVLLNVYQRLILDATDPYKCGALLNHGQWLDSPERKPEHKPWFNWQPPGCLLHDYTIPDVASCSEGRKILFVGDTGTRQVFWATARKIEGKDAGWVSKERDKLDTHGDLEYANNNNNNNNNTYLKFIWDPWLNSSALHHELKAFRNRRDIDDTEGIVPRNESELDMGSRRSMVILVGGGLWHARYLKDDYFLQFKTSVDFIVDAAYPNRAMTNLADPTAFGDDGVGDQIVFAPIIEPNYEELSPSRQATITPDKINKMNGYLQEGSLQRSMNVLWSYTDLIRDRRETYGESGIHVIDKVSSRMADVLLNLRCNAKAARKESYPFDKTCCSAYRPTTLIQITGFLLASIIPLVAIKATRASSRPVNPSLDRIVPRLSTGASWKIPFALATLLLCACYCFLADRTQVFDKFSKEFSNMDFRLLLGLAVIGCLFYIQGSPSAPARSRSGLSGSTAQHTFLPRVQSDEFKGWMQIYILVYGYTNSAGELDFYKVNRVFLALYLFLSGYGHTMYFILTDDYSLQRVASVLVRMNLLPVILSLMMDRPYMSYYFAPLVSFWFLVVYLTLRPASQKNGLFILVLAKILLSAVLVYFFIHTPGLLEFSISVLGVSCRASISVGDWRSYLGTDKYIVFVGMVAALVHVWISSILSTRRRNLSLPGKFVSEFFGFHRWLAIYFSVVAIPVFWILTRVPRNKEDYDVYMAQISWLPVLGFILLRNSTKFLRTYHCAAFAWLGRMSLELYLLSNHIWLAGDGRGILRIGLRGDGTFFNDRWRDLLILTIVFVWSAWKVSIATRTLTAWIVGQVEMSESEVIPRKTHGRAMSELAFPDYDNALPRPNTQQNKREDEVSKRDAGPSQGLGKRLVVIIGVVWVVNLLRP